MKLINILLKAISGLLVIISLAGYFSFSFFGLPVLVFFLVFSALVFCISCNTSEKPFQGDIFCNLVLIALIISNVPGYLWYYCGRKVLLNTGGLDFEIFLLLVRPGLLILLIGFGAYLLIRLCIGSRDSYGKRVILLVAIVLACILRSLLYGPGEGLFLRGMAKTVREQYDTSAILKWLPEHQVPSGEPEIPRSSYYLKGVGRVPVAVNEQPEYVKKFSNGNDIYVLYSRREKTFYVLRHGESPSVSGLGLNYTEWGVVVGLSPRDISKKISEQISNGSRVVHRVSDDVYVWFYSVGIPLFEMPN